MKLPGRRHFAPLWVLLCVGLTACASAGGGSEPVSVPSLPANGPAADYPVVLGNPYTVNGVTYTPSDTLNYDVVGYVSLDAGAQGVTAAHRLLPMPSYIEVTALDSGQTILVRVERRGPMSGPNLIALSPAALQQLGIAAGAPVRVRRVNPPEVDRARLRAGQAAPARMETPSGLLEVLRTKLPTAGSASLRASAGDVAAPPHGTSPAPIESVEPTPVTPAAPPARATAPASAPPPAVRPPASPPPPAVQRPADGRYVVQAAAFSSQSSARRVASQFGGFVEQAGRFWRVRTGPFATRAQAQASLANVRAAGYSDARIYDLH